MLVGLNGEKKSEVQESRNYIEVGRAATSH